MGEADRHFEAVGRWLSALRRRAMLLGLAESLAAAAVVALVLTWAWILLESLFRFAPAGRAPLGVAALVGTLVALALQAIRRALPWRDLRALALRVEQRRPELAQRLISALEVYGDPRRRQLYSPALLEATVAEAHGALLEVEFASVLDRRPLLVRLRALAILGFAAALSLSLSDSLAASLARCAHPLTPFARQPATRIAVEPPDMRIVQGERAAFTFRFSGERPRTARVLSREPGATVWREDEVVVDRSDSLRYAFETVKRPFLLLVEANDGRSDTVAVEVIVPPEVTRLRLRFDYPPYSGLAPRVEEESGDVSCLVGTRVGFEIAASRRIAAAALLLDDSLRVPAEVEHDRARASLEVRRSGSYRVELVDAEGVRNRQPIRYLVEALADAPPQVTVLEPGRDMDLPEQMRVLLGLEAGDDFGVVGLALLHRVNDGPEQRTRLRVDPGRQVSLRHVWDLENAELLPEDRVYYRVEATDNDAVTGPKRTLTPLYSLRFPSLYELYEETAAEQEEQLDDLQTMAEEGRQTQRYLEQARRELLRDEELTWEQRKEMETVLAGEEERARAVEELAQELQKTLEEMEEGGLDSERLLEQIAQIRELMAEVISPELRRALEEIRQALDQEDPRQLAEALRSFNEDQQSFQERLERTIALLERVRLEQRLEAAVAQAADLLARQERVNQELRQSTDPEPPSTDPERLATQEEHLSRDGERLRRQLDELADEIAAVSEPTAAGLSEQASRMESAEVTSRMMRMAEQLRADAAAEARRLGAGLEQDLGELAASMQRLHGEYSAGQKQLLANDIAGAMRDLLALSLRQEELLDGSADTRPATPGPTEEQFALMQGVSRVAEAVGAVSRQTMAVEPPLVATLGYALRAMQQAAVELGQESPAAAAPPQRAAMQRLNEGVLLLRQSLENLAQSRTASSFGEAMQKMMGLSDQQADLNQATQQTLSRGQQPGARGRGMQEELARLAERQRRILEALQGLQQEMRGHRGAEKRLGAIEEDVREALQDLQRSRLSDRTVNAQRRILQRMLDASRSIHTRGFDEEKRRSEVGTALPYEGAVRLPGDLGQVDDALRSALRAALRGPYPDEYRRLIRTYFEQLFDDVHGAGESLTP